MLQEKKKKKPTKQESQTKGGHTQGCARDTLFSSQLCCKVPQ